MNDLFERMMCLTEQLKGKSADYVTHALKVLGGGEKGTMADGLQRIIKAMNADKRRAVTETKLKYGVGGVGIGAVSTGILLGGAWLHSFNKEKRQHEKECQEIIEAFEAELELAREDNSVPLVVEQDTVVDVLSVEPAV